MLASEKGRQQFDASNKHVEVDPRAARLRYYIIQHRSSRERGELTSGKPQITFPCVSTRLFSSRYVSTKAPARRYLPSVNCSFKNFPNRDELLFLRVLAFPKDSRIGEDSTTFWSKFATPPTDLCVRNLNRWHGPIESKTGVGGYVLRAFL